MTGRFDEYLDLLEDEGCTVGLLASNMREVIEEAERLEAINAELVSALQELLQDADDHDICDAPRIKARAAIAKAKEASGGSDDEI